MIKEPQRTPGKIRVNKERERKKEVEGEGKGGRKGEKDIEEEMGRERKEESSSLTHGYYNESPRRSKEIESVWVP